MTHSFGSDFLLMARKILNENMAESEWAQIEASDMFQEGKYVGGFDATEMAFTFSVYENGKEYWFQLTLDEIKDVLDGRITSADVIEADC